MPDLTTATDLADFKLTLDEWHTLAALSASDYDKDLAPRDHVDMLVLTGLVRHRAVIDGETGEHIRWVDEWELTDLGRYIAIALDSISDWGKFSYITDNPSTTLAHA